MMLSHRNRGRFSYITFTDLNREWLFYMKTILIFVFFVMQIYKLICHSSVANPPSVTENKSYKLSVVFAT